MDNKTFKNIIKSIIDRPEDFIVDDYSLTDTKHKISYWIANGFWFYSIWKPAKVPFTFLQKIKFASAVRPFKIDKHLKQLAAEKKQANLIQVKKLLGE